MNKREDKNAATRLAPYISNFCGLIGIDGSEALAKMTKSDMFEMFKNPPTQEEWLRGYKKWVEEQTLSTPLSVYEAIENAGKKKRRRKKNVND